MRAVWLQSRLSGVRGGLGCEARGEKGSAYVDVHVGSVVTIGD